MLKVNKPALGLPRLACYKVGRSQRLQATSRETIGGDGNGQMARTGAGVAALLTLSVVLSGCGSSGTSDLFSSSPLDFFSSSSKVTTGTAGTATAAVDPNLDCPQVTVRIGASTLLIGSKPGQGEPSPLDVRYQGSIIRTARECHVNAGIVTMKVGVEGRIITGPAGIPGAVDVPLRIAVVQEGANPKTVVSKFSRQTVTVVNAVDRVTFTHIDPDVSFPVPTPPGLIDSYVVYVGFDPLGAQPQVKKKPVRKHRTRPAAKPRSS